MAEFSVVSASKQQRLRPDGGTTTVYVVWLETAKGATGQVEVPADVWGSDELGPFLESEAASLNRAFDVVAGL